VQRLPGCRLTAGLEQFLAVGNEPFAQLFVLLDTFLEQVLVRQAQMDYREVLAESPEPGADDFGVVSDFLEIGGDTDGASDIAFGNGLAHRQRGLVPQRSVVEDGAEGMLAPPPGLHLVPQRFEAGVGDDGLLVIAAQVEAVLDAGAGARLPAQVAAVKPRSLVLGQAVFGHRRFSGAEVGELIRTCILVEKSDTGSEEIGYRNEENSDNFDVRPGRRFSLNSATL
jgi:hypothetical protein